MKLARLVALLLLTCVLTPKARAGDYESPEFQTKQPLRIGSLTVRGYVRVRGEAWDWFRGDPRVRGVAYLELLYSF